MRSGDSSEVNGVRSQHDRFVSLLREVLEIRGESVRSVALRAGIPVSSLQGVFEGKTPSIDRAAQICDALGLQFHIGPPRGKALAKLEHAVMRHLFEYGEELDRGARDAIVHMQRHHAGLEALGRLRSYESDSSAEPNRDATTTAPAPEAVGTLSEADSAEAISVFADALGAFAGNETSGGLKDSRRNRRNELLIRFWHAFPDLAVRKLSKVVASIGWQTIDTRPVKPFRP